MAALATTSSLSNYPRLSISRYRDQLRQTDRANKVDVNYSYRGKAYSYSIRLDKTACHFGHYRHWWLCPSCSKRVAVLYCAGTYVCRHCLSVPYGSQLQQPIDRLFSRADAIRQRLGWQSGIAYGNQGRPKGMHFTTYYRLVTEHDRIVQRICGATMQMIDKIKGSVSYE
jgi:hypothetical protein